MEKQGKRIEHNVHSLESNKQSLVRNRFRVSVPLAQLIAPVQASYEDEHDGGRQRGEEELLPRHQRPRLERAPVPRHIVTEEDAEEGEHHDLQHEARHGDGKAGVTVALAHGGQGATRGLEDEADGVGGDEGPPEELGPEARDFGSEVLDSATEKNNNPVSYSSRYMTSTRLGG